VHARDKRGNTLCHYAITKEDDRLLGVLLASQLPKFWFPTNNDGVDILELSISKKARCDSVDMFR
jgi:ankyrin repeat protein